MEEGVFPFGMTLFFGFPIFYLAACGIGYPLWLLYRRYRIESLLAFAAGGGLIGLPFSLLLERSIPMAITSALAGTVSAIVFWVYVSDPLSRSSPER
jgi:hypothetical protein